MCLLCPLRLLQKALLTGDMCAGSASCARVHHGVFTRGGHIGGFQWFLNRLSRMVELARTQPDQALTVRRMALVLAAGTLAPPPSRLSACIEPCVCVCRGLIESLSPTVQLVRRLFVFVPVCVCVRVCACVHACMRVSVCL